MGHKSSFRNIHKYLFKCNFEIVFVIGEICSTTYLVYSQSKGAVFYVACYLFIVCHNFQEMISQIE